MEQPGYAGYVMKMIAETQNIFGYSVAFMSEFFTCLDNKMPILIMILPLTAVIKQSVDCHYIGRRRRSFSYASAVTGISAAEAGDKLAKIKPYLYSYPMRSRINAPVL
jgi:hypothetical protein